MRKFLYVTFLLIFLASLTLVFNKEVKSQSQTYRCNSDCTLDESSIDCGPYYTPDSCELPGGEEEYCIVDRLFCKPCGTAYNICCNTAYSAGEPPGGCETGSYCNPDTQSCDPCGQEDGACCSSGNKCEDDLKCLTISDPDEYTNSTGTVCIECGGNNQSCCSSFDSTGTLDPQPASACESGFECNGGVCRCGGVGEICCSGNTCDDPTSDCDACDPATGECQTVNRCWAPAPVVAPCGAQGQECCATGNACENELLTCDSGTNICITAENSCEDSEEVYIETAIGNIPICSIQNTSKEILRWSMGVIGGIAFLFYIYAGFLMKMSQGDPRKLQLSKEVFVSTTAGIILAVLSAFILRVLGFDILGVFNL